MQLLSRIHPSEVPEFAFPRENQENKETELGTKWGDKWEEKFYAGTRSRQGETWHVSPIGELSMFFSFCIDDINLICAHQWMASLNTICSTVPVAVFHTHEHPASQMHNKDN